MANDLTRSPLIVDTAHATNVIVGGPRRITKIIWSGASTAGHAAEIQDKAAARVVWKATATGNGATVVDPTGLAVENGRELIVPTLQSGVLYLYLADGRQA